MYFIDELKSTSFDVKDIVKVLEETNELFSPPLLSRVQNRSTVKSFKDFIHKVENNGHILLIYNDREILGYLTYYNNDLINKVAYISVLAIKKEFQNLGLASKLLGEAVVRIADAGATSITVKTWSENDSAVYLYKKHNFSIVHEGNGELKLELKLI